MSLSLQESRLEAQLDTITETRATYHDRVARLRPETLDHDMLEEYAIRMLGHGTSMQDYMILDQGS